AQRILELVPTGEPRRDRGGLVHRSVLERRFDGPLALPPVGVVSVDPGVDDVNWIDNVVEVRARQSQLSSSGHRLLPHLRSQIFDGDTSLRNATVQSPL